MRGIVAVVMALTMATTGCASAAGPRVATGPQPGSVEVAAMAEYAQKLQIGGKVRVDRTDGSTLRGTLMKATATSVVVQKNTRIAEPFVEVPIAQVVRLTPENSGGTSAAKAVAIGIASGVGAFFAILAIAFAASGD
jgi:hypothetical protein